MLVKDFYEWLKEKYGEAEAKKRYENWKAVTHDRTPRDMTPEKGEQRRLQSKLLDNPY